ncbi:MAG: hypothetical protein KF718_03885 [Polyangiaceae bacterium]|nr:hypothetical protein [Polyangiaceae bacterium]
MGKLIDVGDNAFGFIAIGQFATGFFALGQIATGVIAIGQVARGFFVIGQVGFGLLSLGMASGGLVYSIGMVGVGGRGLGLIIPMLPRLRELRQLPPQTPFERIARGDAEDGWVEAVVREGQGRQFRLEIPGARTTVKIDAHLRHELSKLDGRRVLTRIRRSDGALVARQMMPLPPARIGQSRWWVIWAAQLSLLAIVTLVFWFVVARPVLSAMVRLLT